MSYAFRRGAAVPVRSILSLVLGERHDRKCRPIHACGIALRGGIGAHRWSKVRDPRLRYAWILTPHGPPGSSMEPLRRRRSNLPPWFSVVRSLGAGRADHDRHRNRRPMTSLLGILPTARAVLAAVSIIVAGCSSERTLDSAVVRAIERDAERLEAEFHGWWDEAARVADREPLGPPSARGRRRSGSPRCIRSIPRPPRAPGRRAAGRGKPWTWGRSRTDSRSCGCRRPGPLRRVGDGCAGWARGDPIRQNVSATEVLDWSVDTPHAEQPYDDHTVCNIRR